MVFYKPMCKTQNKDKRKECVDTPQSRYFNLASDSRPMSFYNQLAQRHEDLQWRILHGGIAANYFMFVISKFD